LSWLGKIAKSLFIFLFFFFSLGLTTHKKCGKVSCHKYQSHIVTSHDECEKIVHRPCSSCISSIQKIMETLLSSPCQLGLREWLSRLRLSHYKDTKLDAQTYVWETKYGKILLVNHVPILSLFTQKSNKFRINSNKLG